MDHSIAHQPRGLSWHLHICTRAQSTEAGPCQLSCLSRCLVSLVWPVLSKDQRFRKPSSLWSENHPHAEEGCCIPSMRVTCKDLQCCLMARCTRTGSAHGPADTKACAGAGPLSTAETCCSMCSQPRSSGKAHASIPVSAGTMTPCWPSAVPVIRKRLSAAVFQSSSGHSSIDADIYLYV